MNFERLKGRPPGFAYAGPEIMFFDLVELLENMLASGWGFS